MFYINSIVLYHVYTSIATDFCKSLCKQAKILYNKKNAKAGVFMDIQRLSPQQTPLPPQWAALLAKTGLTAESVPEVSILLWDNGTLAATGSRSGSLIHYLAVDPAYQGEDLTATVLTHLRRDAFDGGCQHLFLYTKPANRYKLQDLFFYPVAQTNTVLLMEDRKDGLQQFIDTLPRFADGVTGALVMNCDPFTCGHLHVIEQAAAACDHVYVFVLSEERSHFPAEDRLALVRAGTAHLDNVAVLPSGPYMISAATFPTYFLPNRDAAAQAGCSLDVEIFGRHIAPALGIARRFVGSEPLSALTAQYNLALSQQLPALGIQVTEIPRREHDGIPISASHVRALWRSGNLAAIKPLVPATTYAYLQTQYREV